jgi:hypothetical protein
VADKARCQSCGMPIDPVFGNLGTERDGSPSVEFCSLCYREGSFTMPALTVEEMIEMSIANMTDDLGMPSDRALELANRVIPSLRRWRVS